MRMIKGVKQENPNNPSCNGEGYLDMNAYEAQKNITEEDRRIKDKIGKTIEAMGYIARLFGFDIKGRITLVDSKTGKEYK